jgi:hypothetical protein
MVSFDIGRVLLLRQDQTAFEWFLDHVCSAVLGVKEAGKKKTLDPPSVWLTPQLEAFSILCMENYVDMVRDQIENKTNPRPPRWTADGRGKAKNQGWDKEGIVRYNELVKIVKASRESDTFAEANYLKAKRSEKAAGESRRLKRKLDVLAEREKGLEAADDGFSD